MVMYTNLIRFSVTYYDQKYTEISERQKYILKMILDISEIKVEWNTCRVSWLIFTSKENRQKQYKLLVQIAILEIFGYLNFCNF